MSVKISVVGPVLNESPWIGFSIMAALPLVHEFVYALDENSDDGTRELLFHVKRKYAHEKLVILDCPNFHPSDMQAYNESFNMCIAKMTGDAAFFLHPDQVIAEFPEGGLEAGPMAWYTHMTSYAGDFNTVISKGRCDKWKNIHAKKMGLHYYGGYGSQNEDFYHSDVTGKSYKHYGPEFAKYPYQVTNSKIKINHYCELKSYKRRLEKMKTCLRTLYPGSSEEQIADIAALHPRVTLEQSSGQFGHFEFSKSQNEIPDVFEKYGQEFGQFTKEDAWPKHKSQLNPSLQTAAISS